jgi:hypothetical protein
MALVKADGTLLSQTPGGSVLESVTDTDPQVKVLINVYEKTPYDGVDFPTQMEQLRFRAGQVIRQSEWDAEFVDPTITSVSPATGAAAGGFTVTVLGSNFTTGATVSVEGAAGTSVSVKNGGKLTFVAPAKTAGAYDVTVTTAAGAATKTDALTYT